MVSVTISNDRSVTQSAEDDDVSELSFGSPSAESCVVRFVSIIQAGKASQVGKKLLHFSNLSTPSMISQISGSCINSRSCVLERNQTS